MEFDQELEDLRRKEILDNYELENKDDDHMVRDMVRDFGDQIEMFIRSELVAGTARFMVAFSAIVIFTNNVFEINYKLDAFKYIEENFYLISVCYQCVTALVVACNMIHSPFTKDNSYNHINHGVALLVTCQAFIVDDPQLLFTTTIDTSYRLEKYLSNDLSILEQEALKKANFTSQQQDLGEFLIIIVSLAKFILLLAGIFNILEVDDNFNIGFFQHLKNWHRVREHFYRLVKKQWYQITLLVLTTISYVVRFSITDEKIINNIKALNEQNASFLDFLQSFGVEEVYYFVAGILSLTACTKYVFSKNKHGYLLLFFVNLQNLNQYDTYRYEGPAVTYTITLIFLCFYAAIVSFTIQFNQIDPQNVLYKLGHVFAIISMLMLVPAWTYNWYKFDIVSNIDFAVDINLRLDKVNLQLQPIINQVYNLASKLQPCVNSAQQDVMTKVEPGDLPSSPQAPSWSVSDLNENNRAERQAVFNDADSYYKQCIPGPNNGGTNNYGINTGASTQCAEFKSDQDQVISEFETTRDDSETVDKKFEDDFSEDKRLEYTVDQDCVDIQCGVVLGTAISAAALSFVPFAGPAAYAMQMAGRVAYKIFQVGRYLFKFIKPMLKQKNKIRSLATTVGRLTNNSPAKVKPSFKEMLVFVFPLIAGSVSISMMLYKRNPKYIRGENVVLGLYGPLCAGMFFIGIGLYFAPLAFNEVFEIPEIKEYLRITFIEEAGYFALKYSYLLGALSQSLLMLSCLFNYLERREEKQDKVLQSGGRADTSKELLSEKIAHETEKIIEPCVFSIPSLYYTFVAIFQTYRYPYFEIGLKSTNDVADIQDEVNALEKDFERTEGMNQETNNSLCGLIGQAVSLVVDSLIDAVASAVNEFENIILDALAGIGDLFEELGKLSGLSFTPVEVPKGFILPNFFVYIIPFGCSLFICGYAVASYFSPNLKKQQPKIAYNIAYLSFCNIILHLSIEVVMQILNDIKPVIVEINIRPGPGWYLSIATSIGNIMSAVVIYTNTIIPID